MSLRRFRPTLWLTVFTFAGVALLVGLGTWQLERRAWKAELIATRAAHIEAELQPLPARIDDAGAWEFRPVRVRGTFLHDREFHQLGPPRRGQIGYRILTPLRRADGAGLVLVDRGWVPAEGRAADARAAGQVAGTLVVSGVARVPSAPGWLTPDNDPAGNLWYWRDLAAMSALLGEPLAPVVVEADATPNPGGLPVGGQTVVDIPNNHLQYAVTWYALAATLLAVYIVFSWRRQPPRPTP